MTQNQQNKTPKLKENPLYTECIEEIEKLIIIILVRWELFQQNQTEKQSVTGTATVRIYDIQLIKYNHQLFKKYPVFILQLGAEKKLFSVGNYSQGKIIIWSIDEINFSPIIVIICNI